MCDDDEDQFKGNEFDEGDILNLVSLKPHTPPANAYPDLVNMRPLTPPAEPDPNPSSPAECVAIVEIPEKLTRNEMAGIPDIIAVPMRHVNMGFDIKFEEDPFNVKLHGIITPREYTNVIAMINKALEDCRQSPTDQSLFFMGPALLPLIPWVMRNKKLKDMRRKIMKRVVGDFNNNYVHLTMRWQTRPLKELIIMRSDDAHAVMCE
jgi:hypothetical protein